MFIVDTQRHHTESFFQNHTYQIFHSFHFRRIWMRQQMCFHCFFSGVVDIIWYRCSFDTTLLVGTVQLVGHGLCLICSFEVNQAHWVGEPCVKCWYFSTLVYLCSLYFQNGCLKTSAFSEYTCRYTVIYMFGFAQAYTWIIIGWHSFPKKSWPPNVHGGIHLTRHVWFWGWILSTKPASIRHGRWI